MVHNLRLKLTDFGSAKELAICAHKKTVIDAERKAPPTPENLKDYLTYKNSNGKKLKWQRTMTWDFTTPEYRPPEMLDRKEYGFKLDIWSLGCIIYYMCALKHPFQDENGYTDFEKIQAARYDKIPKQYSKTMHRIIDFCLKVNPKDRCKASNIVAWAEKKL